MTTEQWSSVGKKSPRLFHTILDTRYGHAIYSVGKTEPLIITGVVMVRSIKVELYLASTPRTIWYNYLDNPINKETSR